MNAIKKIIRAADRIEASGRAYPIRRKPGHPDTPAMIQRHAHCPQCGAPRLTFDAANCQVTWDDRVADLDGVGFDLLVFLYANAPNIVSRGDILLHMYGNRDVPFRRIAHQFHLLRKAFRGWPLALVTDVNVSGGYGLVFHAVKMTDSAA